MLLLKSRVALFCALLIGVATLLALAAGGMESSAAAASTKTISLYYTAPLTGSADAVGIQGCDGEKLAAANIDAAGGVASGPLKGRRFTVSCLDDGDSADTAASIAARYAANSSVWALSGFYASGNALAAARAVARDNLAVIASNVGADFLTSEVHNVYVILPRLESAGGAAMNLCQSYYGASKVAALTPNFSFIPDYMAGATTAAKKLHMSIVSNQTWPDGQTTNWDSYWTKIAGSGARCVLLGGYPPEQCEITAQGRQLGMAQPVIDLTDSYTSSTCQKEAGQYYAGMIFGNMLPAFPKKSSLQAKIGQQFQKRFHQPMSYYAADGYDSILAVEYAIERGARSRTQLLRYLARVSGPGVGGQIAFTNHRIGARFLTFEEASAKGSLAPVAEYKMLPNGTYRRLFVAKCAKRPTCQKRLGARA